MNSDGMGPMERWTGTACVLGFFCVFFTLQWTLMISLRCKSLWQSSDSCAWLHPAVWGRLCWVVGCGGACLSNMPKTHPWSYDFIMKHISLFFFIFLFCSWRSRFCPDTVTSPALPLYVFVCMFELILATSTMMQIFSHEELKWKKGYNTDKAI